MNRSAIIAQAAIAASAMPVVGFITGKVVGEAMEKLPLLGAAGVAVYAVALAASYAHLRHYYARFDADGVRASPFIAFAVEVATFYLSFASVVLGSAWALWGSLIGAGVVFWGNLTSMAMGLSQRASENTEEAIRTERAEQAEQAERVEQVKRAEGAYREARNTPGTLPVPPSPGRNAEGGTEEDRRNTPLETGFLRGLEAGHLEKGRNGTPLVQEVRRVEVSVPREEARKTWGTHETPKESREEPGKTPAPQPSTSEGDGRDRTLEKVLEALGQRPMGPRALARELGTSPSTASRWLQRLEAQGLVARTEDGTYQVKGRHHA